MYVRADCGKIMMSGYYCAAKNQEKEKQIREILKRDLLPIRL